MMDANEESEIFESLGRVSRTAAAGTMQTAEMASRREQMRQSAKETEATDQQRHTATMQRLADRDHKQEATLASVMRNDSYQRHFWRHAGSEQIADYMTASAHLAPRHPEARSAYMHISDVLRNDYGINIEQMNRDHPSSLMDRHHALRVAFDDYFNRHRMDAKAERARDEQSASIEDEPNRSTNAETAAATGSEAAQETAAADGEPERDPESQASAADETQARDEAAQAQSDKTDAQQYKSEARKDAVHTRAEEATRGRQPDPYQRTNDANLAAVGARDPQAAGVRSRTRQNFPQAPKHRVFSMNGPSARKTTSGRTTHVRDLGVTR